MGRPAPRKSSLAGRTKRTTTTSTSAGETAAIRAWAKAHGHPVSDRGRIHGLLDGGVGAQHVARGGRDRA